MVHINDFLGKGIKLEKIVSVQTYFLTWSSTGERKDEEKRIITFLKLTNSENKNIILLAFP